MDGFIIEKDKPDVDVWLRFLNLLIKPLRIYFKYPINLWNGYLNATPKAKYLDHYQKVVVGSQDWSNIFQKDIDTEVEQAVPMRSCL